MDFEPATQRLAKLIHLALEIDTNFVEFQIECKKSGLLAKLPSIASAPSKFDVSGEEFLNELQQLTPEDLHVLSKLINVDHEEKSPLFLASVIRYDVLGVDVSKDSLCNPDSFTETDIFDLFDANCNTFFFPLPAFPPFCPSFSTFKSTQATSKLKRINNHANTVLNRLSITSGEPDGIKGSSKYFAQITNVTVKGSKAELTTPKLPQALAPGELVILLDIEKPNRHGGSPRSVKFGILAAELARVVTVSDTVTVYWKNDEFQDRCNAMIRVPEISFDKFTGKSLAFDILANVGGLEKPCASFEVSYVSENSGATKKTKISDTEAKTSFTFDETTVTVSDPSFVSQPMAEALYSMVSNPVSQVNTNGFEEMELIKMFLETLHRNWPEQSCLVIVPSREAATLFKVSPDLENITFKKDSYRANIALHLQNIQTQLEKVQILSDSLGLHDYNFHQDIASALMLYEAHIEPRWESYLKFITKTSFHGYPFAPIKKDSLEEQVEAVTENFAGIRRLFASLQQFLPLTKYEKHPTAHFAEIEEFLVRKLPYVVVAAEDMDSVDRTFDNVITQDLEWIPSDKFKRLVIFGKAPLSLGLKAITNPDQNDSIGSVESQNAGFQDARLHISVPKSKDPVEEAKFCVELYKYMRLLQYPWQSISIVYKSPMMKMLMEEMLADCNIKPGDVPKEASQYGYPIFQDISKVYASDYMIVSCQGEPLIREYQKVANLCGGLYMIGSEIPPIKIKTGRLELYPNEVFKNQKDRTKMKFAGSAENLAELVQKLERRHK